MNCDHEFVSIVNLVVKDGFMCEKCGALSRDGVAPISGQRNFPELGLVARVQWPAQGKPWSMSESETLEYLNEINYRLRVIEHALGIDHGPL